MTHTGTHPFGTIRIAALLLVAAATLPAWAGDTHGPGFGTNRYTTAIAHDPGEEDVDDYVSSLVAGEQVAVSVTPAKGSGLRLAVELLGPDGVPRPVTVKNGKNGSVATKAYRADTTGAWTVRVRALERTSGAYTIAFRTTAAAPFSAKKVPVDAGGAEVPFEAVDGAVADVTVSWKKGSPAVSIQSVTGPSGGDVLDGATVSTRGTTATLRGLALTDGDGAYRLGLAGAGATTCNVSVRLRMPDRPVSKSPTPLAATEPCLAARAAPLDGIAGYPIRVSGARLVPGVRIWFGATEAAAVTFLGGGTEAWVTPPVGEPGATVSVAAVQPDGQACVRGDYFRYVPAPSMSAMLGPDGQPLGGWTAAGGVTLRITGQNFRDGQVVRFPGNRDASPDVLSATEMTVVVPASTPGLDYVCVIDEWGQSCRSGTRFEMKAPVTFASSPYDPSVGAENVADELVLSGTGFDTRDRVFVDGAEVESRVLSPTRRSFQFPARGLGYWSVEVHDCYGGVTAAPDFRVKPAPSVTAVSIVSGPSVGTNGIPVAGGTTLSVTGSSFDASDTVTLGGRVVTKASQSDTAFTFVAPAGALGPADLVVTDGLGRSAGIDEAMLYTGFADDTATRVPAPGATDHWGATRGANGDLDGDDSEDLVIAAAPGASVGTRNVLTRVLLNDGSGVLADATSSRMPAYGADPTGQDDWNAHDTALADLDGDGDADLLLAGRSPNKAAANDLRILRNSGTGTFSRVAGMQPAPESHSTVYAYDEYGQSYQAADALDVAGDATSLAIGDVDGDDVVDVIVGRSATERQGYFIDPDYVDWGSSPPYVTNYNAYMHAGGFTRVNSGTRVYLNGLQSGGTLTEGSRDVMPSCEGGTSMPAYVARDVALADLNGDGWLDLVLTWDDPVTASVGGQFGDGSSPIVATRVLINNSGVFTDATSTWLPAAVGAEYLQADRLALTDLNGDGRPDLVLLLDDAMDAWLGGNPTRTASALRIFRNDGSSFTAVTSSVLPTAPTGDDRRGGALTVGDANGDGRPDLLVGTTEALTSGGQALRATRLFLRGSDFTYADGGCWLPSAAADRGQTTDLLLGDLAGDGSASLLLLSPTTPATSTGSARLRAFRWDR